MKILTYANWKQKLPFDDIVYKDVRRFSLRLNSYERNIINKEIDFYRTNFSLIQVMKYFKTIKTKTEKETFIKSTLKKLDYITYIPNCLVSYFKKLIKEEYADYVGFFGILLEKSISQNPTNITIDLLKTILGYYYKPVIKKVNKYYKQKELPIIQKNLKPEAIENTARAIIYDLQFDKCLSSIYGRSDIRKTTPISVVNDYGYGEWISKNVSFANNRFFIYSNNNKITNVQLEHMVYFNVYPGYGYFYNTVVDTTKNNCFDNGATFLINGWAMYAMCRSKNTAYSTNMLIEGSTIAHHLLSKNLEKAYEDIYVYLLGKYPKSKVIDYMIDYTQYPCHYLSYILGCFATDIVINKGFANTPQDYLNTLSTINCGDFFALYHPKIQRLIAKNNITAKVSKKFT